MIKGDPLMRGGRHVEKNRRMLVREQAGLKRGENREIVQNKKVRLSAERRTSTRRIQMDCEKNLGATKGGGYRRRTREEEASW